MKCKRCGSTHIREYWGDVVNVSSGLEYFSYVACEDCGLHADYEEWLDEIPEDDDPLTEPFADYDELRAIEEEAYKDAEE